MPPVPDPATGLAAAAALLLLLGGAAGLLGPASGIRRSLAYLPALGASLLLGSSALLVLSDERKVTLVLASPLAPLDLAFRLDPIRALFLLLAAAAGAIAAVAAADPPGLGREERGAAASAFHGLLLSLLLLLAADSVFPFVLGLEASVLAASALTPATAPESVARRGRLVAAHAGVALVAMALLVLAARAGATDFTALAEASPSLRPGEAGLALALFAAGVALYTGLAPLGSGAVAAEAASPPHAAALSGALATVASLYALERAALHWVVPAPAWLALALLAAGAVSLLAATGALALETDARRLAATAGSALTALAVILLGAAAGLAPGGEGRPAGAARAFALAAALYVVAAAVVTRLALTLGAGALEQEAGTSDLDRAEHLSSASAIALLPACLAGALLPPSCGFAGLWVAFQTVLLALEQAAFAGGSGPARIGALLALPAIALAGPVAAAAFLRLLGIALARSRPGRPASGPAGRGALLAASLATLVLGVLAGSTLAGIARLDAVAGGPPTPLGDARRVWVAAGPVSETSFASLLSMPALLAALLASTLVAAAFIIRARARGARATPLPASGSRAPAVSASGLVQPFALFLRGIAATEEGAEIAEGDETEPRRILFYRARPRSLGAFVLARSAGIGEKLRPALRLAPESPRAGLAWLLGAAALLSVLGLVGP